MSDIDLAHLAADVRELKDVREINDLWFKWHHDCTGGFNGKHAGRPEALECLTEDATIEIQGLHEPGKGPKGREAYTEYWDYYYGNAGPLPYVFQTSVANRVSVTGDTAVQESVQLIILQRRGEKTRTGLAQRTNYLTRTPEGWRINKTTQSGGYHYFIEGDLIGNLNELPDQEPRSPWRHQG